MVRREVRLRGGVTPGLRREGVSPAIRERAVSDLGGSFEPSLECRFYLKEKRSL